VRPFRIVCAAFLFVAPLAAAGEPIRIAEVHPIAAGVDAPKASHGFSLHAYTFRGTRWTGGEIEAGIAAAARLLEQCGVTLTAAELRVVDAPRAFHYYHTPTSRRLLQSLDVSRPAVFFVEDTRNVPAFDAEAVGLANSKARPELANTVWVAYGARDLPQAIAHELVHVLSDNGAHSKEAGNLMQDETSTANNRLTPKQCELLRTRGEANGVLRRRPAAPS
jgi:hypothetical protein